ncbi:galactosylceramide sulfotransferase [Salvelinus sp. IW2-2015]|uniref:galactosylceramide sulfotransferase n=1 Tax=Salvelinus sp. IW2-2015 TaxID=2691554 RepID=UPI000CDF703C|nr:galactosylceramide sulfotransferase [Salvelinus alpinus]
MLGFGVRKRLCKSIARRLAVGVLLTSFMVVLHCLSTPAVQQVNQQKVTVALSCSHHLSQIWVHNLTNYSQSRTSLSGECVPKVDIMFMKTHKTASSTLLNIIFRFGEKHGLKFAFPKGRNDFFYPSPFLCSQVKDYQPGVCFNILCNHMRFNGHEVAKLLPADAPYFTILRDPAELFESSFHYYSRAIPLTWGIHGDSKLAEFLREPMNYYTPGSYNSFYLKNLLFFDFGFDNNLEPDHPLVERGIQTLSQRFQLVLMAEHFEESLILLKDTLCWTMEDMLFFKLNARKDSSVSRLTPELKAKAREWNGADWRLYQHFNATFWAKVEAYGWTRMEQEVKELRRRNAEMAAMCIEGGGAVEAGLIRDTDLLPWQPVGENFILGYNLRKNIDPKYRELCRKMLTPEIQYLSELGVNLWLTRLWGWLKDTIF